jgi:ribosomal protein S18 acetylase RimI-like enzyme
MAHPLDNPVWHALTGPQSGIALGRGAARHYPRDMAPFSAVADPTAESYADLAADLPLGAEARLFRPGNEPAPEGWEAIAATPIRQMTATVVALGPADAPDMQALAEAAKPGPFGPRTVELGFYAGMREPGGRLVAMAGERFRLPGYGELSAVCVHPDARGKGFGAALTLELARHVSAQGAVPFLHVFPDNPAAALYARLGFRARATLWVLWRRPRATEARR